MSDGSVQMSSVLRFMQRHYFLRLQAASSHGHRAEHIFNLVLQEAGRRYGVGVSIMLMPEGPTRLQERGVVRTTAVPLDAAQTAASPVAASPVARQVVQARVVSDAVPAHTHDQPWRESLSPRRLLAQARQSVMDTLSGMGVFKPSPEEPNRLTFAEPRSRALALPTPSAGVGQIQVRPMSVDKFIKIFSETGTLIGFHYPFDQEENDEWVAFFSTSQDILFEHAFKRGMVENEMLRESLLAQQSQLGHHASKITHKACCFGMEYTKDGVLHATVVPITGDLHNVGTFAGALRCLREKLSPTEAASIKPKLVKSFVVQKRPTNKDSSTAEDALRSMLHSMDPVTNAFGQFGFLRKSQPDVSFVSEYFDSVTLTFTEPLPWSFEKQAYIKTHTDYNRGWGLNVSAISNFEAWDPTHKECLYFERRSDFDQRSSTPVRTFYGPGFVVADFSQPHGSMPMRHSKRWSMSWYQNDQTQLAAELENAGATLSTTTSADEFRFIEALYECAWAEVMGGSSSDVTPQVPKMPQVLLRALGRATDGARPKRGISSPRAKPRKSPRFT
jgi:hypothetical protein